MKQGRGKGVAVTVTLLGLAVLAAGGHFCRSTLVEQWYLWKLDSGHERERKAAATKLADLRSERAIPKLLRLLLKTLREEGVGADSADYTWGALHSLRPKTLPALVEARKQEAEGSPIHEILTRLLEESMVIYSPRHGDLVPALTELLGDARLCRDAADCLGYVGPAARSAVPSLIRLLEDPNPHEWWNPVRRSAAEALGKIGPATEDVVPALRRALKATHSSVRASAARALGRIDPPAASAIPALQEALRDADGGVGKAAADSLEKVRPD